MLMPSPTTGHYGCPMIMNDDLPFNEGRQKIFEWTDGAMDLIDHCFIINTVVYKTQNPTNQKNSVHFKPLGEHFRH